MSGAPVDLPAVPPPPDPFEEVRAHYRDLCRNSTIHFDGPPAGRLLLAPPLSQGGGEWLIAASVAGAASLSVDSETAAARAALRSGSLDFSVTKLDEALRILKNEIRKQQPVSVCVERPPADVLAEMIERGVQPDLIVSSPSFPQERVRVFSERGAVNADAPIECGTPFLEALSNPVYARDLERNAQGVRWSIAGESGASALRILSQLDALVSGILPSDDWQRQRWLRFAQRYLPRPLRNRRALSMSREEAAAFESAIRQELSTGELTGPIELQLAGDPPILLQ